MTHPIPDEALNSHIAILGKTGSGKSNAAKTIVEAQLDRDERVCIIDPTGSWYGLRLKAEGSPSGYPVVIFGGQHGDKQIGGRHGAAIAEVVATSSTPAVIDTRLMSVGERTTFFKDFAETLLRRNRGPLRLVIDEAHLFAPQAGGAGGKNIARNEMLHAANNLVSLGRSIGLRIVLISQRPAKLHKDSLTQVETLVAMRLIHNLDVDAVKAWIGEWADPSQGKEIVASLPSLPTGDAWVWSPEIGVLTRAHFPLAGTYDSGKAPSGDEAGPNLQPINLDRIDAMLDKAAADIKANDPRALKAEVTRLTKALNQALAAMKSGPLATWPDQREEVARLAAGNADLMRARDQFHASLRALPGVVMPIIRQMVEGMVQAERAIQAHFEAAIDQIPAPSGGAPAPPPRRERATPPKVAPRPEGGVASPSGEAAAVPSGCGKPLAVLASAYPGGMTEGQWATAAGYKKSGGTWKEYRSRLRRAEMIETRDGMYFATDLGAASAGPVELPPAPGPELARWWAAKISGTPKMVEALIEAWPHRISKDELAELLEMTAGGGTFKEYVSRLARNGIIHRNDDGILLSPEVMGA